MCDIEGREIYIFLLKNTQKLRFLRFAKELRCNRLLKYDIFPRKSIKNTQFLCFFSLPKVVGLESKLVGFHRKTGILRKFKDSTNYFGVHKFEQFREEAYRTGRPYA